MGLIAGSRGGINKNNKDQQKQKREAVISFIKNKKVNTEKERR